MNQMNLDKIDFELFCFNVRGLAKNSNLLELLKSLPIVKSSNNFLITLQETKINYLKEEHKKTLRFHKLKYFLVTACAASGGLITLYPEHLADDLSVICKTTSCLALYSEQMQTYFLNAYVNPKDISGAHLQKSTT